jgi:hypothetical protein
MWCESIRNHILFVKRADRLRDQYGKVELYTSGERRVNVKATPFHVDRGRERPCVLFLMTAHILCLRPDAGLAQHRSSQPNTASYDISGTVLDPSGALVPGAHVSKMYKFGTAAAQIIAGAIP